MGTIIRTAVSLAFVLSLVMVFGHQSNGQPAAPPTPFAPATPCRPSGSDGVATTTWRDVQVTDVTAH